MKNSNKMKKILLTMSVVLSSAVFAQESGNGFFNRLSNVDFGVRASGLLSTTTFNEFEDVTDLEEYGANVGIAAKINVNDRLFVTPELYYFYSGLSELNMPVLFGYTIINDKLDIIAGPNLMYTFAKSGNKQVTNLGIPAWDTNFVYRGIESTFEVGYMAGLQYHFGKFMVTGRYQGGFTGKEILFTYQNPQTGLIEKGSDKLKTSYVSLGVGFNFGGK